MLGVGAMKKRTFSRQTQRLRDTVEMIKRARPSLNNKLIARQIGYSEVGLSRVLNEERGISERLILRLSHEYGVNPDYLRMLADDPWPAGHAAPEPQAGSGETSLAQDIRWSIEVLESNTPFASALQQSIRGYHHALETLRERDRAIEENSSLRAQAQELEREINRGAEALPGQENFTRSLGTKSQGSDQQHRNRRQKRPTAASSTD